MRLDQPILGATSQPDLLLINSPLRDYDQHQKINEFTLPTLGLGYIATCAEQAGFAVSVLDAEAAGFGVSEIAKVVNKHEPKWVGLNLLAPTYKNSIKILKAINREINVMLGGHQAKAMPRHILEDAAIPRIDALVLGEAELRVPKLLADLSNRQNLQGILWRENNEIQCSEGPFNDPSLLSPDINALPHLDRKFLLQDPYEDDDDLESAMVGSRGCPFDCSFCGAAVSANPDVVIRMRTPDSIISEIQDLKNRYDVSRVRFVDDLFLADRKKMTRTLGAFVEERISVKWDATGRINVLSKVGDETIELMRLSGCNEVALGIEAGSNRLLAHIDKKISVEQIESVVPRLCRVGIDVKGYFILGLPTETREEHCQTINLIERLWELTDRYPGTFRCSVFEYRPYPGTPDWRRLLAAGYSESDLLRYEPNDRHQVYDPVTTPDRDEFNFSTGLQFGEVPVSEVRRNLSDIMRKQRELCN